MLVIGGTRLSPEMVFLILYPVGIVALASFLKILFRNRKLANVCIISSLYVLSNLAIYFFMRGGFSVPYIVKSGKGLAVFADFTLREWLRTILIPHIFTVIYIVLVVVLLFVLQKVLRHIQKRKTDWQYSVQK